MADTKTQTPSPDKAPPPPVAVDQAETPEKETGPSKNPLVQRTAQAAGPVLSPARAADMLAGTAPGPGAPGRAHLMTTMQQSVGNTRASRIVQRQPARGELSPQRQDVVVIVGRPSRTIPAKETPAEKEQMETWRAAAHALSPVVYEGLTVDRAFAGLKKLRQPIGKLFIIGHADESGVGEVGPAGETVSTSVKDLTARLKKATGALGPNKPESVEMLSCFGGGSPKTMSRIGEALGTAKIRAPVWMTVISGRTIKVNGNRLTTRSMARLSDAKLIEYVKKIDAWKYYDFVPGVPHPPTPPSNEEKLAALADVLRRTGMIPFISFNAEPGNREAMPYWKAPIQQKGKGEELSPEEQITNKGLIEVNLQESQKTP